MLLRTLRLDVAERAAQFINFPLVGELLALGNLDQFEHFIHLVVQFLQRVGDESRMRHGFVDGGVLGGTEIGGLDPLALGGRHARRRRLRAFVAPWLTAKITAFVAARFARWRFRRCGRNFCGGFVSGFFRRLFAGGGKFGGRFRVRLAETTFGFRLVGFRVFVMFHGFGGRGGGFNPFCSGRNFFGVGRTGFGTHRTRSAATAATATAPTAVAGGTAGRI